MHDPSLAAAGPEHRRVRFSLRWLFGVLALVAGVMALGGIKLRQDERRDDAFAALREMGLQTTIASESGQRELLKLRCQNPQLDDSRIADLVAELKVLARPHDLGLSPGLEPAELDLAHSRVTPSGEQTLREAFPQLEIKR